MTALLRVPFTLQFIRDALPDDEAWRHPMLMMVGQVTTWVWVFSFTVSTLVYLVGAGRVLGGKQEGAMRAERRN